MDQDISALGLKSLIEVGLAMKLGVGRHREGVIFVVYDQVVW